VAGLPELLERIERGERLPADPWRSLVPAQVAPGNAASVRAFLAAGYRPVGAEVLLVP
jgi:hypothetical protein